MSRLLLYSLLSTSLFTLSTLSALSSRPNFYSAAIHLGRSSASLMVLANFGVWLGICVGLGVKRIFFGTLRGIEYEHLFERLWLFLTESLLALTIFRDDFSAGFAMMYGLLVFLKCFHWITADRVDYMDQIPQPGPPTSFHLRIGTILTILASIDLLLVLYSLDSILTYGVSAKVLFVSEFMVLLASIHGTMARYVVNCLDIRRARGREDAPAWERKSMYMFYIDLGVDFAKLLTYLTFFTVILLNYGIPLHILRDVWMTFRSFVSRCSDLIRYRRATRDMDAQYPNATEEDVGRLGDRVCIICREEMVVAGARARQGEGGVEGEGGGENHEAEGQGAGEGDGETARPPVEEGGPNETPKKLVCGHVFHFHCLRSWLERQQSCPTCRRDVLHTPAPTRNRRPAPAVPAAAPAPGAAPQLVNQNNAQLREEWNEFFRIPDANGAIPGPTPAHVPAPAPAGPAPTNGVTAGPTPAPTTTAAPNEEGMVNDEDGQIQTSIWGGPIQPGRFFAPPLGSIRPVRAAYPRAERNRQAGPSRPVPIRTFLPQNDVGADTVPPLSAAPHPHRSGFALPSPSAPVSEVSTPFSSNPPEVFRSMSSESDESRGKEGLGEAGADDGGEELDTGRGSRRLAAEAAMRRLGLRGVTTRSGSKGKEKEKEKEKERTPSVAAAMTSGSSTPTLENTNHIPYLAPIVRVPHTTDRSPWSTRGSRIDLRSTAGIDNDNDVEIRERVDERLKTLKRVDDTIWGLVEELTRIKSLMEVEAEGGADGHEEGEQIL